MPGLNAKQQRFVEEYLIDKNATQAAIRAGYSEKTAGAIGHELLKKPEIDEAVRAGLAELAKRSGITAERVLKELALIGFANMRDYIRIGPDGDPYLDFSDLTREQAAAILEVTVDEFKDGRTKDSRDIRRVRFKLGDKRAALVDLGRHLALFTDNVKHSGEIKYTRIERRIVDPSDKTDDNGE